MANIFSRIGNYIFDWLRMFIQGDSVSSRFFKRHIFSTLFIILTCMMMIAMRFDSLTSKNTIDALEVQINVMSTDLQKERSRYMTLTRESAMANLVDSLRLGLDIPTKHPQELDIPLDE